MHYINVLKWNENPSLCWDSACKHWARVFCQCASASRSFIPSYMAHTLLYRTPASHWKWSSKSPSMWHPQLQHMLLCVQKYDCTIQYKPGKEMVLADHLSHFPSHKNSLPIPIAQNIQHIQLFSAKLDVIWGSVEQNPVYSTVASSLEVGSIAGSKSPRLPDISGEPGMNCLLNPASSSRGNESAFPQNYLIIPL